MLRWIVRLVIGVEMLCAASLAALVWLDAMTLFPLFTVAVLLGIGRAFAGPALSAIAPNIVPHAILPSAIAMNSIAWQAGAIIRSERCTSVAAIAVDLNIVTCESTITLRLALWNVDYGL